MVSTYRTTLLEYSGVVQLNGASRYSTGYRIRPVLLNRESTEEYDRTSYSTIVPQGLQRYWSTVDLGRGFPQSCKAVIDVFRRDVDPDSFMQFMAHHYHPCPKHTMLHASTIATKQGRLGTSLNFSFRSLPI